MNGYIASTITVHTSSLVTHSNARTHFNTDSQSCQSPDQWLFLPSVPRDSPGDCHSGASPQPSSLRQSLPAFHTPANGTGLQFTTRRLQMANGFPYSASLGITSHGVLWGDVSLGPLFSGPRVRLQLHYFILSDHQSLQQGQRRAEEQTPSPQCSGDISCTKMQETAWLPCSFSAHLSAVMENAKCCLGSGEP